MPATVTPMAAHLADNPPSGNEWLYEIKWDGVRAICFIEGGRIRMISRNGNSFDRQYPELSVIPNFVKADTAILDGEIAVVDAKGRSSFGLIQPRIHQTDPNAIAHLVRSTPVKLFVFDLLYLDGYDLRNAQLIDRKELLRQILEPCPNMQYSEHFVAQGQEMLEVARSHGLEGIMAKCITSKYESRRSRNWLKLKLTGRQEFVICGYTHGGERETFSSLVLGVQRDGEWVYVGNVGTGFNEKSLAGLFNELKRLETKKCPFAKRPAIGRPVTWVMPELVCEIKFTEWTRDGRLRAPVFMGLRDDKRPDDVVREEPQTTRFSDAKEKVATIDGVQIKFSNLQKIFYPKEGYTKGNVLDYYDAVSDFILPHLKDRPLSLKRYPNGIHQSFFFQKNTRGEFPDFIRTEHVYSEHNAGTIEYALAENRASLLYLVNLGCIDQNPWMSRVQTIEYPDFVLIDLDPVECPFDMIIDAMQLVKAKLDIAGLQGYPKTTGGDGLHIYIPIEPLYNYDQVRGFAEVIWNLVYEEEPNLFTTPRAVAKRKKGRVYFDYLQIALSKTIAAPYVLRAYDGAPVATPLDWKEVKRGLKPHDFTIENAVARFNKVGDLFKPVLTNLQRLEPALKRLSLRAASSHQG
jgi:bifunctional non-homologous end joining protein LigD